MSIKSQLVLCSILFFVFSNPVVFADQLKIGKLVLSGEDRILVLASHPDDDILGLGGVIQQAVATKLPLKIVYLTNGDSSKWFFIIDHNHPENNPGAVNSIGIVRRDEAINACHTLGVDQQDLIFSGYPDIATLNIWHYHWNQSSAY